MGKWSIFSQGPSQSLYQISFGEVDFMTGVFLFRKNNALSFQERSLSLSLTPISRCQENPR